MDDIQCVQKVEYIYIYTKMHWLGCKFDTDLRIIQCQDSSIVWNNLSIIWQHATDIGLDINLWGNLKKRVGHNTKDMNGIQMEKNHHGPY